MGSRADGLVLEGCIITETFVKSKVFKLLSKAFSTVLFRCTVYVEA